MEHNLARHNPSQVVVHHSSRSPARKKEEGDKKISVKTFTFRVPLGKVCSQFLNFASQQNVTILKSKMFNVCICLISHIC